MQTLDATHNLAGRHHQGRHPALAVRHDGDFRDHAQRRHADAHRGAEQEGRLLGKKLEAVVVDPASDWPLFAEKARELIEVNGVDAVFGCWTSVSRKSVLPVFEELNSLLFYPVQYEGEESQRNVFYTGAAPNQQAIPAVDYLMNEEGVERWVLAGTDYVYPRTTNKILEAYLKSKGVAEEDIMINYTPFGHSDWQTIVSDIKKFGSAGKKTAVVSTINGDANVPFYKELGNPASRPKTFPVVAFSVGEEELAGLDTARSSATWPPGTTSSPSTRRSTPSSSKDLEGLHRDDDKRVTNDPMEAHYIGFNMWVEAVEKAGTTDPDAVIDAIVGVTSAEPDRRLLRDDAEPPHHQAGADRRDPGRRPVRDRLGNLRPRRRRCLVRLSRRLQGPDRGLARSAVLRKLQHRNRQMRRSRCFAPSSPTRSRLNPPTTTCGRCSTNWPQAVSTRPSARSTLGTTGDPRCAPALEALSEGDLYSANRRMVFIVQKDGKGYALQTRSHCKTAGTAGRREVKKIKVNNRLRRVIRTALGSR
jgi:ABC-type branched-subunit amino acid transport system substrate-binding protein